MKMRTLLLCVPVLVCPAMAAGADAAPAPRALQALSSPKPNMPDVACQQRLSGFVELDFAVLPSGAVADVRVTAAEPKGLFDAAAIELVAGRTYPPQDAPIKARERLPLGPADCRVEQLKATADVAPGFQMAPQECVALAAQARTSGERFDPIDSGRAILGGTVAQVYAGPNAGCPVVGKSLTSGARWRAHVEYNGFSLISPPKADEAAAVWVRSNTLKDVEVPGLAAAPPPAVAVPVSLPAPAPAPSPAAAADLKQLLALHDQLLRAHLAGDVEQALGADAAEFVQANRGAVARANRAARKAQLGTYLKKTRFAVYRDQIPPIAKVSADGTLGWVIAQVEARGEQTGPDGTPEPLEFVSAWVELYEKRDGRWVAVGNVSNFKR